MIESENRQQQAAEHALDEERRERTVRYFNGEIPFQFDHEFSNGARLIARQSDQGEGSVVIEKNRETVFDAASLLPEGYRLITPAYFNEYIEHLRERSSGDYDPSKGEGGAWKVSHEHKLVLLGLFTNSIKDLLSVFHEIGHARDPSDFDRYLAFRTAFHGTSRSEPEERTDLLKEMARANSVDERRAWAFAVLELRRLCENIGIDAREVFSSQQELTAYIHERLITYRRAYEYIPYFHPEIDKKGVLSELPRLFDRGKGETSGKE